MNDNYFFREFSKELIENKKLLLLFGNTFKKKINLQDHFPLLDIRDNLMNEERIVLDSLKHESSFDSYQCEKFIKEKSHYNGDLCQDIVNRLNKTYSSNIATSHIKVILQKRYSSKIGNYIYLYENGSSKYPILTSGETLVSYIWLRLTDNIINYHVHHEKIKTEVRTFDEEKQNFENKKTTFYTSTSEIYYRIISDCKIKFVNKYLSKDDDSSLVDIKHQ